MSTTAPSVLLDRGQNAASCASRFLDLARRHAASRHPFFEGVRHSQLTVPRVATLLKNYDAHASVLRRLLLRAVTIMPEPAVGFILENVRNEYGNGVYDNNHQFQLKSVARSAGVSETLWRSAKIQAGVKSFIRQAHTLYFPSARTSRPFAKAAIAAGAITATELLAIEEFKALQEAFERFGLAEHVWFDHVSIEAEHSQESLDLALHFCTDAERIAAVEYGLTRLLDANVALYDGLLCAIQ